MDKGSTPRVPLYLVLSSDHVSPATGKTVAITISKNGGSFANPSGGATNATEIASGWYYVDLSATDTNTSGPLIVLGIAASCDHSTKDYVVSNGLAVSTAGGVTLADGVAHGGTTASLILQLVSVINPSGSAITAHATGGNGSGFDLLGEGTGPGLKSIGGNGSDGHGIFAAGGTGSSSGLTCQGGQTAGHGINSYAYLAGHGLNLYGTAAGGVGHGLYASADTGGSPFFLEQYDTGPGFVIKTAGGDGISIHPIGTGVHGLSIAGGDTTGDAVHLTTTDGKAISATSGSSAPAIFVQNGSTGNAIEVLGLSIITGNASQGALTLRGGAGDYTNGLLIATQSDNGPAFEIDAGTNGPAIEIEGPTTGDPNPDFGNLPMPAIHITTTATDGIGIVPGGSGVGINAQLSSDAIDLIAVTAPTGPASNFREMMVQVWRRFFKKSVKVVSNHTIKTYADNGTTVVTTQTFADDGAGNETLGAAS